MTYQIKGLDPAAFAHLLNLGDDQLARQGAVRMVADAKPGFPCRITLTDAEPGETLLLVNYCSHKENNPYRATHAIFVSEKADCARHYVDELPSVFEGRTLSLRAFDGKGMMTDAALAQSGEADAAIRHLLSNPAVDHIDAHNATRGCFAARVDRA